MALYTGSITNYFQSDDFILLKWASGGMRSALIPSPWEFYRPCVLFIFSLIYKIFSASPIAFRLTAIIFQLSNCILLSLFAFEITRNKTLSMVSAILFACTFYHSEVMLWISCFADILLTFFCILTLLSYHIYCHRGGLRWYMLSLIWFCCAIFSKETAFPLFFILAAYHIFAIDRVSSPPRAPSLTACCAPAMLIPFLAPLCLYLFFKAPTGMINPPGKIAVNYTQYILYGFVPFLTTYTHLRCPAIIKIGALLSASGGMGLLFVRSSKQTKFLAASFLLFISLPAICTVAEARYLFFPGCFSSIILATAFVRFSDYLGGKFTQPIAAARPPSSPISVITLITICLAAIIPQVLFVFERAKDWASASATAESIIESVREVEPYSLAGADTYFVNLPDGIPSRLGYAYIFRNGIVEALYFAYGGRVGKIEAVRMAGAQGTWRGHGEIAREALKKLSRRGASIFVYSPDTHGVKKYERVGP